MREKRYAVESMDLAVLYNDYTMSNILWDYIDEVNNREEKRNPTQIKRHDSNIISRLLIGSKNIYLKIIDIIRNIILVDTILYYRSREQSTTYLELCGVCIALILVFAAIATIQRHIYTYYMEYEWFHAQNSIRFDNVKMELFDRISLYHMLGMIGYVFFVLPAAYFYYDWPELAYVLLLLASLWGFMKAFEEDWMLWRITIGRRLSVSEATSIYDIVMHNRPANWWEEGGGGQPQRNTLEMRFFFVDVLRRDYTNLDTVKELLDVYPAYLDILDRDGVTTPFELACQFASADIVLHMLGLTNDIDINKLTGSEKLHLACGRGTAGSLKVVNHVLDFHPYLVTVPNKDGDLPIHVAGDTVNTCPVKYQPECTEILWRLLLAYPECLSCVGGSTVIESNEMSIDDKKNK